MQRADPEPHTVIDSRGVVRSVQAVEVSLPADELARRWTSGELERLGAAYFHSLRRTFLGVVRAMPTPPGSSIVALGWPLVLLRFDPATHRLEPDQAEVRWPIRGGLLSAPAAEGADRGHLAVEVRRLNDPAPGRTRIRVTLEVAGFRPAVAAWLGRRIYLETQARVHLLVAHRYLDRLPAYFPAGRDRAGSGGRGERAGTAATAATAAPASDSPSR